MQIPTTQYSCLNNLYSYILLTLFLELRDILESNKFVGSSSASSAIPKGFSS